MAVDNVMALYIDSDNITHYVHLVPLTDGKFYNYLHCASSLAAQRYQRSLERGDVFRTDITMNCLWCACNEKRGF